MGREGGYVPLMLEMGTRTISIVNMAGGRLRFFGSVTTESTSVTSVLTLGFLKSPMC